MNANDEPNADVVVRRTVSLTPCKSAEPLTPANCAARGYRLLTVKERESLATHLGEAFNPRENYYTDAPVGTRVYFPPYKSAEQKAFEKQHPWTYLFREMPKKKPVPPDPAAEALKVAKANQTLLIFAVMIGAAAAFHPGFAGILVLTFIVWQFIK